jgi:ferrous iron transport protein B
MWERAALYLKKAGTIILGIAIILWALTTFPGLPEEQAARFEKTRQEIKTASVSEEKRLEQISLVNSRESEAELVHSAAGRIGHAMEPLIEPMGFDWKIGTALIGAFAAKEVFVAQMGIVYSAGEVGEESVNLRKKLRNAYSPLVAFCIMLFSLISAPCMATIAVTKRESNSWGWALFQLTGLTFLAYVLTMIVYQVGSLLNIGIG